MGPESARVSLSSGLHRMRVLVKLRDEGLEPTRVTSLGSKPSASANSANPAQIAHIIRRILKTTQALALKTADACRASS